MSQLFHLYVYRLAGLLGLLGWALPALAAPPAPATQSLSLEFVENKGQWAGPVRYSAALPGGGQLFAEAGGLRLALLAPGTLAHPTHPADASHPDPNAADRPVRGHTFDLRWVQASPDAVLSARTLTTEHRNYLRGNDPARWARDVRSYRELRYAGLWPGIDARFYENEGQQLEYDLELAPGADPARIGLRHDGAQVTLEAAGNLLLTTTVGPVQELAPRAWQLDAAGQRHPVACRFRLDPAGVVGFQLGAYDRARPLVIDPTLVFATFSGSAATNWGYTATYDAQGNLYSGGIAFSLGYPATLGAFQTTYAGLVDIALIKYDITQTGPAARVWATYLGGSSADYPHSLIVNANNELLLLGATGSANFPTTTGAVQRTFGGGTPTSPGNSSGTMSDGSDMVVCRLAANGASLLASTYLGGSGNDGVMTNVSGLHYNYGDNSRGDIALDAAGNVYIASYTNSRNFPFNAAASFQPTYQGGATDGVVCKLSPSLGGVLWGGYLGGTGADAAYSLQLTPGTGELYVAGATASPGLPATAGALNAFPLGNVDGFITRLSAGGTPMRSTYLGTAAYDQALLLQLGADGGVYVVGQSLGNYPTTPGRYANANGRQFIHKLTADLASTQLATVFGAGRADVDFAPNSFLVDECERVYVCGWGWLGGLGNTNGLPLTPGALQTQTDGSDFYLAQFSAGLTRLDYATYFGVSGPIDHVDGGTSRFDPRGTVYQATCTCAYSGYPTLPGAGYYSNVSGGGTCNNTAFVMRFPGQAEAGPPATVCQGGTLPLAGTPTGGVWTGPGVSGSVGAGYAFAPPGLGTYTLTYTVGSAGPSTCTATSTRQVTVLPQPTSVDIDASLQATYCLNTSVPVPVVPLVGVPAGGTFSGVGVEPAASGTGQVFNPGLVTSGSTTILYTLGTSCRIVASRSVNVLRASVGADQTVCANSAPVLLPTPTGVRWSGPGVTGTSTQGFLFTPTTALTGTRDLTYTIQANNGLSCSGVRRITVLGPGALALTPLPTGLCLADNTAYPLAAQPAGGNWQGPGVSYVGGSYYFTPSRAGAGTFALTYTVGVTAAVTCTASQTMSVAVNAPSVAVVPPDTLLCPGTRPVVALRSSPAGGTWAGAGVSGSPATGFTFTPPAGWSGSSALTYTVGTCPTTVTRRIGVAAAPAWQPTAQPAGCPGDRQLPLVVRFADAAGNAATRWDFGDGSPAAAGAVVTHTYRQVGSYQPRATLPYNNSRCELSSPLAAVEVVNVPVPNIVLPGGHPLNRTFRLPPTGCLPRLQLFSRWGQRVYEAAEYHDDWDAAGQAAGLYFYLVTYPDGRTLKGWLEVVR